MFRNYLAAALRNLARNRLYAAINILGLSVGFAVAILVAVFVRNEFSYDRFIPGYEQVYLIAETITQPGSPPIESDFTQSGTASGIAVATPGLAAVARLAEAVPEIRRRRGDEPITEPIFAWVDPDFFKVMPLPVLAGDLQTALQQPDTVVITRHVARKYFGRDKPIGDTLEITFSPISGAPSESHTLRVTAVLQDLPSNTHLGTEIYASGRSAYSMLAYLDLHPIKVGTLTNHTYVRLAPNETLADLQRGLDVAVRPVVAEFESFLGGTKVALHPVPLTAIHLRPAGAGGAYLVKPRGDRTAIEAIATVGLLIVVVASINFVTLMTARATRRALEVGVRKVAGARRIDLVIQFMGEALIYVALAMLLSLVIAGLLLKPFSAFVQRDLGFDRIFDPVVLAVIVAATAIIGLAAGVYPALVLSAFRPASVLKGGAVQAAGSPLGRQALVVAQFAILVCLILTTITVYRQTTYALKQGQGASSNLIMVISTDCKGAFPDEVRRLPGVRAAACSAPTAINSPANGYIYPVGTPGGARTNFDVIPVDFGFFELFGVKPVAGRLFAREHGGNSVTIGGAIQPPVIINETGARKLGFAVPGSAVGHTMLWPRWGTSDPAMHASEIIGVLPDAPVTVRATIHPTFYFINPPMTGVLSVRLTGRDAPGVVRAIGRVWKATGQTRPINTAFLSQFRLGFYMDIVVQAATIAICAGLAVVIAGLGLFALSAFVTERRTKEIGVRKVMGASTLDVVRLLMWQFTVPVLWAIALACPIGWLVMDRWLRGFAFHVDPSPWTFVLAAGAALVIAWITVSFQSFIVARAKPVGALRYE